MEVGAFDGREVELSAGACAVVQVPCYNVRVIPGEGLIQGIKHHLLYAGVMVLEGSDRPGHMLVLHLVR